MDPKKRPNHQAEHDPSSPFTRVLSPSFSWGKMIQFDEHLFQMSNEKNPGWLGYIGDDKLPSYIGIIINHYKDPY